MKNMATRLRELLAEKRTIVKPAAYDALTAKLIERAGFDVVGISGYAVSVTLLGKPDVGLVTQTETVMMARYIVDAVNIPVMADGDTGYGNAINTMRTIEQLIKAGVAGAFIEDQEDPKRCGHVAGKQIIPMEEMVGKIRAADRVRKELNPDFVLMARCDARGAVGGSMDELIRRSLAYVEAGADMIFPEGITSEEELIRCIEEIPVPIQYNRTGISPMIPVSRLEELGVKIVADAGGALRATARAVLDYLHGLKAGDADFILRFREELKDHPVGDLHSFVGFPEFRKLEEEFLPAESVARKYAESLGYQPSSSVE